MKCPFCKSKKLVKAGRVWGKGLKRYQRYRCNNCGRSTIYPKKD